MNRKKTRIERMGEVDVNAEGGVNVDDNESGPPSKMAKKEKS
jgi:hypothetical protein